MRFFRIFRKLGRSRFARLFRQNLDKILTLDEVKVEDFSTFVDAISTTDSPVDVVDFSPSLLTSPSSNSCSFLPTLWYLLYISTNFNTLFTSAVVAVCWLSQNLEVWPSWEHRVQTRRWSLVIFPSGAIFFKRLLSGSSPKNRFLY